MSSLAAWTRLFRLRLLMAASCLLVLLVLRTTASNRRKSPLGADIPKRSISSHPRAWNRDGDNKASSMTASIIMTDKPSTSGQAYDSNYNLHLSDVSSTAQMSWKGDKHMKQVALRPVDSNEWKRLDNQECVGSNDVVEDWQHRIPHVVITGAMKAGTEALWLYLKQHPQIVGSSVKEQHFFDVHFERFATVDGIRRDQAQQAYAKMFRTQLRGSQHAFGDDSNSIAIDNTPRYLFWSDRIPGRLLCVAPWVKLIVLLRNPVERAYSHYIYTLTENFATKPKQMLHESFEDWIAHDMKHLTDSGVLDDPFDMTAWKTYLRTMKDQTYAVIGKGLYAIQLRHWFSAMKEVGKPRDHMLILESQRFKSETQEIYSQILEFLGLPEHKLVDSAAKHSSRYSQKIKNETQEQLANFFRPFNYELYKLLGWKNVWD